MKNISLRDRIEQPRDEEKAPQRSLISIKLAQREQQALWRKWAREVVAQ